MELKTTDLGQKGQGQHLSDLASYSLKDINGTVHFIGIGGIGMSALARLLLAKGISVSGSDKSTSTTTDELAELGARILIGHNAQNIVDVGAVVVSTAIVKENPELAEAIKQNVPVWHRSQMLAVLSKESKLIAITGTHGKTTTTGMISQVLLDCGLDPSVVVGGIFPRIGSNAIHGQGNYFVAEADESDGTHTNMQSFISVITNIEPDHLENYPGGIKEIEQSMISFANGSSHATILCKDDPCCISIAPQIKNKVITYGQVQDADYSYKSLPGYALEVTKSGKVLGNITLRVPGEHNKLNSLAAIACGIELGLNFKDIAKALEGFSSVARRFQILGEEKDILVIDDYAHHPTEVRATLEAAKSYCQSTKGKKRIVAVFQPHQPGRLKDFWQEFCQSFTKADLVLLADVYIARGGAIEGINSARLAKEVNHSNVHYIAGETKALPEKIVSYLEPGDLVLTIGAGDITKTGWEILKLLKNKK